jgi:hypothetical protein
LVGGHDVQTVVAHERGRAGDGVEELLDARADALLGRPAASRGTDGLGGPSEVEQVRALGVVELQRPRQRFEHALRDTVHVAPLQAGVVGDADAGEHGDLLAAQPGHAADAVVGQPDLVGRQLGAP